MTANAEASDACLQFAYRGDQRERNVESGQQQRRPLYEHALMCHDNVAKRGEP